MRINITAFDETKNRTILHGWFDDATTVVDLRESKTWNGNNMIGVISGGQVGYASLIRTAGGRWVEYSDFRNEYNGGEKYRYLTDDEARDWLMRNETDESTRIYETYFGAIAEEQAPPQMGRPEIGPEVKVRLPHDAVSRLDAIAAEAGVSRAEQLRRVILAGL